MGTSNLQVVNVKGTILQILDEGDYTENDWV